MRRYLTPITLGLAVAGLTVAMTRDYASPTAASGPSLMIVEPEKVRGDADMIVPPPLLQTSDEEQFADYAGLLPVRAEDRRPIAQLSAVPDSLKGKILTYFAPAQAPLAADEIAYDMIATVEYRGSSALAITTSRPSAAAARQRMLLGTKTLSAASGRQVWQFDGMRHDRLPSQVAWSDGGLIVTAASDLPLKELLNLVDNIQIAQ